MLPRLTRHAVKYIDERASQTDKQPPQPFFLYVPYGSPHTPIVPSKPWQGKSGISPYADFVMQTDAGFGEILDALYRHDFDNNTLVIFSSDNGCSKAAGFDQLHDHGHYPSAHLRGSKADIWDGGHRIPFIVRWPGHVQPKSTSDQMVCLTDLFATCAELLGQPMPTGAGEDSVSILPAFSGQPIVSTRAGVIHHSFSGHFAYRLGKWKLCLAKASGGWSQPNEKNAPKGSPPAQLYDMQADPGETTNLFESQPDIAQQVLAQLEADVKRGRSTNGPPSENDFPNIQLWKSR